MIASSIVPVRLMREAATAFATIAACAFIALATMLFVEFVHVVPTASVDGVVGWTTIHGYSKNQELANYVAFLLLSIGFGAAAWFVDRRLRELTRGEPLGALARITIAVPVIALALHAASTPHAPVLADFLIALVATGAGILAMSYRYAKRHEVEVAIAPAERQSDGGQAAFERSLAVATLALNGIVASWFLAVTFANSPLAHLVEYRLPICLVAAPFIIARLRHVSPWPLATLAAACSGTFVVLVAIPALGSKGNLAVVVAIGLAAIFFFALRRAPALAARVTEVSAAVTFVVTAGVTAWARNPNDLAGQLVGPLDGDATLAWINDGLLGLVPFRDFWYPYGALQYLHQLVIARVVGIDRFASPLLVFDWSLSALCIVAACAALFGRRWFTVVAVPLVFLAFLPEPRVWLGLAAITLLAAGIGRGQRLVAMAGGATLALSMFWSIEVFASAFLATIFVVTAVIVQRRQVPLNSQAAAFAAGGFAGLVLLAGCALSIALGGVEPLVDSITRTLGTVDACCAQAYPSIFGGLTAMGISPTDAIDVRYIDFWIVPGIYAAAIVLLVFRTLNKRALRGDDLLLAALVFCGAVLFRSALSRSEFGHLSFVSAPAGLTVIVLVWDALRRWRSLPLTAVAAVVLFCIFWPSERGVVAQRLYENSRYLSTLPAALTVKSYIGPTGWDKIPGPRGEQYYFSESDAADIVRVRDFLRARLRPDDRVYGVPYTARYEFLLDLPSPGRVGPIMWGGSARISDQSRLVETLRNVRFVVYDETEWPNTDGVSWMDRYPLVADALAADYHIAAIFGTKLVLERGTPAADRSVVRVGDPANQLQLRRGFYAAEPLTGLPSRWTAPFASLVLDRAKNDDVFVLDFVSYDSAVQPRTLSLTANGTMIGAGPIPLVAGEHRLVLPVPHAVPAGSVNVALSVSSPLDAVDLRALGVVVRQVGFAPSAAAVAPFVPPTAAAQVPAPPASVPKTTAAIDAKEIRWSVVGDSSAVDIPITGVNQAADLLWVQLLVNDALNGTSACYASVYPGNGNVYLLSDNGVDSQTAAWHSASVLANSQCAVPVNRVSAKAIHGGTSIRFSLRLLPALAQRAHLAAWARLQVAGGSAAGDWVTLPVPKR